jgi:plasmid stability protein
MAAIIVRDLPSGLHQRLKKEAQRHHRSMNREIIAILEKEMNVTRTAELPPLVKPSVPVDGRSIADALRKARDERP